MPVKLNSETKEALGQQFQQWVTEVEDDRRDRMHEIYVNALRNYEGKEPVKNLPWPGASNAVLPITGTHSDAIASRLYNAATAHDPIFLIRSHGKGEFIPGLKTEDYARYWANISKWIEQTQIDYKELMEENILTFVNNGDAFVYPVWKREEVLFPVIDGDKERLEPTTTVNKPELSVIHPKDVLLKSTDKDPQSAEMAGFLYPISILGIEQKIARGEWDKEAGEKILEQFRKKSDRKESVEEKAKKSYYNPIGGEYSNPDEYVEKMRSLLGIDTAEASNQVQMVRLYWRVDLDNKGLPAEYIADIEKESGILVKIDYNRHIHKERPLNHYRYSRRAGTWMSRGVPELLFNIHKIMSTTMRDILDNNKIRNSQVYLLKKGGAIKKQTRIFPGKHLWVDSPDDFTPAAMGTGTSNTSVQDISIMERWGQLITGITDFNLGQEKRSRTPAATTLALIEQGNQRLERPIDTMRKSMEETHWQVLQLYLQHYDDLDGLAEIADADDPVLFKKAWIATTPELFRQKIKISPEVSSNAFNRQSQRQEALALSGYVEQLYQKVALLAQQIGAASQGQPAGPLDPKTLQPTTPPIPPNPTMVALLTIMAKGLHRMAKRVLDTFDVKEQEDLNPETLEILAGAMTSDPNLSSNQDPNSNGPTQTAGRVVAQGGNQSQPAEAPGRPQSGQPRVPGPVSGQPG